MVLQLQVGGPSGFTGISTKLGVSNGVLAFETFFHRLSEPDPYTSANYSYYWDRSSNTGYGYRRAFYTKPLIVSSGPDETSGIFRYPDATPPGTYQLIANENNAMPFALDVADFTGHPQLQNSSIPMIPTTPPVAIRPTPGATTCKKRPGRYQNQNLSAVGNIGGSG